MASGARRRASGKASGVRIGADYWWSRKKGGGSSGAGLAAG